MAMLMLGGLSRRYQTVLAMNFEIQSLEDELTRTTRIVWLLVWHVLVVILMLVGAVLLRTRVSRVIRKAKDVFLCHTE